ncbi:PilN domain-containing protein [Spiribacter vilamensis]|uniref:Type IV pilus assembly protein PilN n=1 Tax=Spiribacter vilamensis TaxID=531306 RepID=A0A4Q8D1S5_9GAMM|nr:hypothetical protein [Spiribacter vilamensis]RZU99264.1 type IV pilus assembly protein PilN [Spiribacter vilamensis]
MPIGVNLLPWRERRARRERRCLWLITGLAGLAGLTIMVATAAPIGNDNAHLNSRQTELRDRVAALAPNVDRARRMDRQIDRLDARQSAMDRLRQRRTRAVDALTTVVSALPPSIALVHLEHGSDRLVIEGLSPKSRAIPRLIDALRATPGFTGFRIQRLANRPSESAPGQRFRLVLERNPTASPDHDR